MLSLERGIKERKEAEQEKERNQSCWMSCLVLHSRTASQGQKESRGRTEEEEEEEEEGGKLALGLPLVLWGGFAAPFVGTGHVDLSLQLEYCVDVHTELVLFPFKTRRSNLEVAG